MHIIAVSNQKGGVAKTTTASALTVGLAARGKRVLAIDLDAQANLTYCCGVEQSSIEYSILDLLLLDQNVTIDQVIRHNEKGFDVIPSTINMSALDQKVTTLGKEYRLKEILEPIKNRYDYIILDTPPQLALVTLMAMCAATDIIVPSSPAIFDVYGMYQLNSTVNDIRKYLNNPGLRIMGILLTKCNTRTKVGRYIRDQLEKDFCPAMNTTLFRSTIRTATAVIEAQTLRNDILSYAPSSSIAQDYMNFVDEVIERS